MIVQHAFNTSWFGEPVGKVDDPAFFSLPLSTQNKMLSDYAWVDFSSTIDKAPPMDALMAAKFQWVDTQVDFRINLTHLRAKAESASLKNIEVQTGADIPFEIGQHAVQDFVNERFLAIRGVNLKKNNERFAMWADSLLSSHPKSCLQMLRNGIPQGWFLSRLLDSDSINLTLAFLRTDASISGLELYEKALRTYADQGVRIGSASFSVHNSAVLNIYSALGARFLPPRIFWLWQQD